MPVSDMQEKKNKQQLILSVVLLVSIGLAYYLGRSKPTFDVDSTLFAVEDLKSVNEVVLQSPAGKINLKYSGAGWKINQEFAADRNMIDVLFATLKQAQPKRPVSSSKMDSLSKAIETNGVKVSLISGGVVVKEFYAAGNASKSQSYFKLAGAEQAYLMTIPGYRVYTSGIFELPVNGWRDKYVFGFNWRNFKSLDVAYPQRTADNFYVQFQNDFFGVSGIEADTAKLNSYLDAVSLLQVDEYVNANASLDSLRKTTPVLVLTIKDAADSAYYLHVYPPTSRNQFVVRANNDWATVQDTKMRTLFRPRAFFEVVNR